MKRNLLYNCYAPTWTFCQGDTKGEWELNVEKLCQYAHVFNHRKVVIVREGPECHPPEVVEAKFAPLGEVEFIRIPNNFILGEVFGLSDALGKLKSLDPNEITFYAHTKGTKYHDQDEKYRAGIRKWRDEMYECCLRDADLIDKVLSEHATAGCFRRVVPCRPLPTDSAWHFAGTFWWVNHKELFSIEGEKGWNYVYPSFWGVEAYLGRLFPVEKSYCLNRDVTGEDLSAYLFNGPSTYRPCPEWQKHADIALRDEFLLKMDRTRSRNRHLELRELRSVCTACSRRIAQVPFCPWCRHRQEKVPLHPDVGVQRFDIINRLIQKHGYGSYLEIGIGAASETFNRVRIDQKTSVDPLQKAATYVMTSDAFFSGPGSTRSWDIIFVDGLHHADQVCRDIDNALARLNAGGTIVVHDCKPIAEITQRAPKPEGLDLWNGDTWKAWVWFRTNCDDLKMCVVDVDHGCGIIHRGKQKLLRSGVRWDYVSFLANQKEILNLISWKDWLLCCEGS